MGQVRACWAIARASARRTVTYRAASFAGIVTNCFFGVLLTSMITAVTSQRPVIDGVTESDLVTQVWLTQGLLMVTYIWGWTELSERIRSGEVIADLLRPVSLPMWWFAHDAGRAAVALVMRGVAPFVVGALLYHLRMPTKVATIPLITVSLVLAWALAFSCRYLVNLTAFWLGDARSVMRLAMVVWTVLSGSGISLALFPGWLEPTLRVLPFAGIFQTPIDVWLERPHAARQMVLQLAWSVVLVVVVALVTRRAERNVVANGG
jgi:ABC-2 type transport system permease protein